MLGAPPARSRARSAIVYDARARAFVREWKERGRRASPTGLRRSSARSSRVRTSTPSSTSRAIPSARGSAGTSPARPRTRARQTLGSRRHRSAPTHRGPSAPAGLGLEERRRNVRGSVVADGGGLRGLPRRRPTRPGRPRMPARGRSGGRRGEGGGVPRRERPLIESRLFRLRTPERSAMRLQVKAHNGTISDTVRAYAEKRLGKLGRRLYDQTVVEVTLSRAHNPRSGTTTRRRRSSTRCWPEHRRERERRDVRGGDRPLVDKSNARSSATATSERTSRGAPQKNGRGGARPPELVEEGEARPGAQDEARRDTARPGPALAGGRHHGRLRAGRSGMRSPPSRPRAT